MQERVGGELRGDQHRLIVPAGSRKPLRQEELPSELHQLGRLNAVALSNSRYEYDSVRLLDLIEGVLAIAKIAPSCSPIVTDVTRSSAV